MKNIEDINRASVKNIASKKKVPKFFPGDTIRVGVRIVEGKRERIQNFEGVCIAKKNRDINSSFTVRKISFGEGVERTFALYSPIVSSIKVIRSGKVKRAKLYYLRDRKGKSARIVEKIRKNIGIEVEDEWETGHVTGAIHIPVDDLLDRTDEIPTDKKVLFICAAGVRSGLACEMAASIGFDSEMLYNIEDGTPSWIASGLPTTY